MVKAKRVYHEVVPVRREDAINALTSGDPSQVCEALVQLAFHEPDRAFVESVLATQLESGHVTVRMVAATCVGHLARIHRALDVPLLLPLLRRLGDDPRTVGSMEDALSDVRRYVGLRT